MKVTGVNFRNRILFTASWRPSLRLGAFARDLFSDCGLLLMERASRVTAVVAVLAALLQLAPTRAHAEGDRVRILVLKEHGVGSSALAQPYVDRFVALAAEQNGWTDARGQYCTNRSAAEAFIAAERPHFGILSLAAFLPLQGKYHLEVIGQVAVSLVGGRQYYVISKMAADLATCKGKTLASDHTDDTQFIERVVAAGHFKLTDFTVIRVQRPLQTIRKVITGDAVCALIDDAQLAELAHVESADGLHPVWKSTELPPMAVVAFPAAGAEERHRFQETLTKVCENGGESICAEVGIVSLKTASASEYASVLAAYSK